MAEKPQTRQIESTGHYFESAAPILETPQTRVETPPTHNLVVKTSANEGKVVASGNYGTLRRIANRIFGGQQTTIEEASGDSSNDQ